MAQLTRKLEETMKRRLKRRAARHRHSMEEEIRQILRNAVKREKRRQNGFGSAAVDLFRGIGLKEPIQELRGYSIQPPRFDDD